MIALVAGGALGVALLALASDHLVLGAARLAAILRMPPAVVAALVIGFGTSSPELALGAIAAAQGQIDLAIGNVIGSNLANVTLVLGVAALVGSIAVTSRVLRVEGVASVVSVLVFAGVLVWAGGLSRLDGVVLLVALVVGLAWMIGRSRREGPDELAREVGEFVESATRIRVGPEALRSLVGLAGTLIGAQLVVWSATGVAERLGLAEGFVGVTLVAVGTSLPELVTAAQASRRGEHDLIIGNLLGSNLFNSLGVAGVAALVGPGAVSDTRLLTVGVPAMVAAVLVSFAFMMRRGRVTRPEAVLLLVGYAVCLPLLA